MLKSECKGKAVQDLSDRDWELKSRLKGNAGFELIGIRDRS